MRRIIFLALPALLTSLPLPAQDDPKAERAAEKQAQKERDERWKEAAKAFSTKIRSSEEGLRIAAIADLAVIPDPRVIDTLAPYCRSDSASVRTAAIQAISAIDNPKSSGVLAGSISANQRDGTVLRAVIEGLKRLDWEEGARALNPLLKQYQDPVIQPLVSILLDALGSIGSMTSFAPIVDLLSAAEAQGTGGYNPQTGQQAPGMGSVGQGNQAVAALAEPCKKALGAITGRPPSGSTSEWKLWLKDNEGNLHYVVTYLCPESGRRWAKGTWEKKKKCPTNEKHTQDTVVKSTLKKG